ncbi:MAG: acyl-CoA thioesterase [Melioribacteraceae bacterium]|nr:acyl-CoA thioesterase [Melioribacteraceae bacterium]
MIRDSINIRPRYGEVDRMGYVYHANYITYFHQARTELLRKYGIDDNFLELNNIMLPVIEMNTKYLKPSFYDEEITIITTINEIPSTRFKFNFEVKNSRNELVCQAESTLVFCDSISRKPGRIPSLVKDALINNFEVK